MVPNVIAVGGPTAMTPEERARLVVQEAEKSKARIYSTKGNEIIDANNQFVHTIMVDENYMVIGSHIDEVMVRKIVNSEYVDFGKLIPRDKVLAEEDGRMEMVVRSGKMFWVPVNDSVNVNSFRRWEQAFRIYSNIYTKAFPHRSSELIQYNHIIHTISLSYTWDNVYTYDKEFRIHISKNPGRSWAVILQQAWSMRLKDRIQHHRFEGYGAGSNSGAGSHYRSNGNNTPSGGHWGGDRTKVNEPCRRFNRGKCNFGPGCKYEHRCLNCGKFGHGLHNCRRLNNKGNSGNNSTVPQVEKVEANDSGNKAK